MERDEAAPDAGAAARYIASLREQLVRMDESQSTASIGYSEDGEDSPARNGVSRRAWSGLSARPKASSHPQLSRMIPSPTFSLVEGADSVGAG